MSSPFYEKALGEDRMTTQYESVQPRPAKRDEIIAEAIRQFNSNGFFDTRLEDIGERLGTAKTSISYHFKSKEGLLLEAYHKALDFSEAAAAGASGLATGRAAVLSWIQAHAEAHADALAGLKRPLALISEFPEAAGPEMDGLEARHRVLLHRCREFLEQGCRDGSIQVSSIASAHFFLMNVIHWLPRWLSEVRPVDYPTSIRGLINLLTHGLAANPSRAAVQQIGRSTEPYMDSVFDRDIRNRMKREAFLRSGTRALNERGFRNLSLNEVAAELGVTRGAFYYHIADKDALLIGCFERTCSLIETAQQLAQTSQADGLGILERCLRWIFERQISNLDPLIRLSMLAALPKTSRFLVEAKLKKLRAEFSSMLAMGMIDNSIRPLDLEAAEHLLIGSVLSSNHSRLGLIQASGTSGTPGENVTSHDYFEILMHGLAGRPETKVRL
jgi:AcrR family transcriptional regulator